MTTPSRLDLKSHPGPPRPVFCGANLPLHDGSTAKCEGLLGHEGPHVSHITVTWDSVPEPRGPGAPVV